MPINFSPSSLYRLPWNLNDNSISWLEPTYKCNLYCDGCYRENRNESHKPLEEIKEELDLFEKLRRTDGVSIAGGEPLTHPQIADIVALVKEKGWKPIINSNGALLTKELLQELKQAGVYGFTFHIDSGQNRPGWKDANELELNDLRYELATMLKKGGNISCSFNATVYPETLEFIPQLVKWAQDNIDRVNVMVFILYRMALLGKGFDFYVKDNKVSFEGMTYSTKDDSRRTNVQATELVELIQQTEPEFAPCAFLGGTHNPETYKWLLTCRIANKHKVFGYTSAKFMEMMQTINHLFTGSYLAYAKPSLLKKGRLNFLLAPFDPKMRDIFKNYLSSFNTDMKAFFSRVHSQSIMIIQPADIYENGDINMCDGCPDMTVWNGKLVWSCRMEEQMKWGDNVKLIPSKKGIDTEKEVILSSLNAN